MSFYDFARRVGGLGGQGCCNVLLRGRGGEGGRGCPVATLAATPPWMPHPAAAPQVDPAVARAVDGLNCSYPRHYTYLDVEPHTGTRGRGVEGLGRALPGTPVPEYRTQHSYGA